MNEMKDNSCAPGLTVNREQSVLGCKKRDSLLFRRMAGPALVIGLALLGLAFPIII